MRLNLSFFSSILRSLRLLSSMFKVLIGVKFVQGWPFLGRLRVCFAEPPYFQMTVKPIFTHGIDVTEIPGIAGWLVRYAKFMQCDIPFSCGSYRSIFICLGKHSR